MPSNCARIQVFVRVRPFSEAELAADQESVFSFPSRESCLLSSQRFSFDRVFGPEVGQEELFDERFKEIVDHVLDGFNGSIIAYGQTAAGKSYTMSGGDRREVWGIIPRAVARILANTTQPVQATFVELYNDKLQDLFNNREAVVMLGDGSLKNAKVITTDSRAQLMDGISHANGLRAIASTNMNSQSSRSHAVLQLRLGSHYNHAKLVLVDLAGSEKAAKTGATGAKLGEAGNINKSLTVLAMVIQALGSPAAHIPYRDSKLTQLLRDSINGNSKTALIVNCSPSRIHEHESFSSLRFGCRAKLVEHKLENTAELKAIAELRSMRHLIKTEIQQWELHDIVSRERQVDLSCIRLPSGYTLPEVNDPYADLLENDDQTQESELSEDVNEKERQIRELACNIQSLDSEIEKCEHTLSAGETGVVEYNDSDLQVKQLTAAAYFCQKENKAVMKRLTAAESFSSNDKIREYLRELNRLCDQYQERIAQRMTSTPRTSVSFKKVKLDSDGLNAESL